VKGLQQNLGGEPGYEFGANQAGGGGFTQGSSVRWTGRLIYQQLKRSTRNTNKLKRGWLPGQRFSGSSKSHPVKGVGKVGRRNLLPQKDVRKIEETT